MSNAFSNFINKQTGEVVYLPAHYGELFPNELEATDLDVECVDCNTPDAPEEEITTGPEEASFASPIEDTMTEPARRSRRTKSTD